MEFNILFIHTKIWKRGGARIRLLLFVSILVFVYCLLNRIKLHKFVRKYILKRNINYVPNQNKNYNSKILKIIISKIQQKDIMLNNLGNPYGLNGKKFYIIKVALPIFFLQLSIINKVNVIAIIVVEIISFLIMDILVLLNKKSLYNSVQKDLQNVIDSLYLQITSNITMDKILRNIPYVCNNNIVKSAFISMSNVYEYTGFNIQLAVLELKKRFDIVEVNMFCNVLVEQTMLGENLYMLENLSNILAQKNIEMIKTSTRKKVMLITIGIAVSLINISLLVFYPIINTFSQGFNNIFY